VALKFANNQSLTATTALPAAVPTDNLILISTQTASNSANISFTGINGTYDEYIFKFINIHPASSGEHFTFNLSTDNGSNYNVTKTTTWFYATHNEGDTTTALAYSTGSDLAQSTAFQKISDGVGNGDDESASGTLTLFNPASTTYVKHFIGNANNYYQSPAYSQNSFVAGYGNTTSAINAVRFQMTSGNIDDGIIKLYGVKKS
jgi:hypothetical protein